MTGRHCPITNVDVDCLRHWLFVDIIQFALTLYFSLIKLGFFTYVMFCVSLQAGRNKWTVGNYIFSIMLHAKIVFFLATATTNSSPQQQNQHATWIHSLLESSAGVHAFSQQLSLERSGDQLGLYWDEAMIWSDAISPDSIPKGSLQLKSVETEGEGKEKWVNQKLLSGTLSSESPRVCP